MNLRDKITITMGNLIDQDCDAIVNAANTDLILGSGVAGAIRAADDGTIQNECKRIGTIPLGKAAITSGGATGIRYVIHAAGMQLGGAATVKHVRRAIKSSLARAREKELRTVAFPAVGTGVGGLSCDSCAEASISAARDHLAGETTLEEIRFVLFNDKTYQSFKRVYDTMLPPD